MRSEAEISPPTKDGFAAFASIFAVAIAGNAFVALSPLFVGAMADYWGMRENAIGALVSYEFLGTSVATILGIFFLHRPNWPLRATAFAALALFALGNLITPFVHQHHWLLVGVRILCGLCAGFSWIVSATAIAHLKNNKRALPLFYGSPFFVGMVFQPIMPSLFSAWGLAGGYFMIAAGAALCFLLYGAYLARNPPREAALETAPSAARQRLGLIALVIASLTVQFIANTGLWTYFERIGIAGGHSLQTTANVLSVALAFAMAGALLASALAERVKPIPAIVGGTLLIAVASILVLGSENLAAFLIAASLFNLMITFITPFYFIVLEQNYDPAKGAILGNIAMILGFSAGPVMIGYTIIDDRYVYAVLATLALFALSAALVGAYVLLRRKAPQETRDAAASEKINAT